MAWEPPSYPPTVPPPEPEPDGLDRVVALRDVAEAFKQCVLSGRFGALELVRIETAVMSHVRAASLPQ